MDNPTVTLLNTLLALTLIVPGIAAVIGARGRKTSKFKGPFDSNNKPKTFDLLEKQRLDAESATGKLSVLPETPVTPAASGSTLFLPQVANEEPHTPPPAATEPPARPVEFPAEPIESNTVAIQKEIPVPERVAAPAPTPDFPVPAAPAEETKPLVPAVVETAPSIPSPGATIIITPQEKPVASEPAAPSTPPASAETGHNSIEQINLRLAFAREMGDRRNEATALADLGGAHLTAGAHRKAIAAYEQAVAIYRELHDRQGEADALGNLGLAHEAHGDLFEPIELFEQALLIYRDLGDRRGEASALWTSSLTFNKLGNRSAAVSSAETALRIFEELGDATATAVRTQLADWRAAM